MFTIGILALQGAFQEHANMLDRLNVGHFLIRKKADLQQPMDGLIIPGGESTTMGKLLHELDMFRDIKNKIEQGIPVFGTCAGMILLAKEVVNDDRTYLQIMNIKVKRNAYGRQLGSFLTHADFKGIGVMPMTFIRAPYIESVDSGVEELAVVDGHIVAALERNILVCSFHPELTDDVRIHDYFIEKLIKK